MKPTPAFVRVNATLRFVRLNAMVGLHLLLQTNFACFSWSHSKLNAEKSLTLFSALFFYLFQGLKWEKRGDEW
jgi:hypothetical protein